MQPCLVKSETIYLCRVRGKYLEGCLKGFHAHNAGLRSIGSFVQLCKAIPKTYPCQLSSTQMNRELTQQQEGLTEVTGLKKALGWA